MKDVRGDDLKVGDEVYIYWGGNELRPGKVHQIKGNKAKVLVDSWPNHPDPEHRYSMSKWKSGECMIKATEPTGWYPDEVVLLIQEIIRLRDEAKFLEEKIKYQDLLNFWDKNRPCNLVCS
ncbi:hypothetical protein SPLA5a_PHROGS00115 [Salmonella phage SPLA5a]|nr:hypothetical protein SPLA5a_PHROGS00115 [Salmonella phage SPLA5a]